VKEEVRREDNSACISHAARSRKRRRRIMLESTKELEEDNSASTNHLKAERERRAILPASTVKEEIGKEDNSACISHTARNRQRSGRRSILPEGTTQLLDDSPA
jgi:hypothetical protein